MAKKKKGSSWAIWLPLIVGILVTPITIRMASILALSGTDGLAVLYPWVQIVKSQALKIPGEIAVPAAQWVMYLQFPIYGLLMSSILRGRRGFGMALFVAVIAHAFGLLAVFGLGFLQTTHIGF